jgi:hypothetical protein
VDPGHASRDRASGAWAQCPSLPEVSSASSNG